MKKILITGAGGNVGLEVIKSLFKLGGAFEITAGIRNKNEIPKVLAPFDIGYAGFDFENEGSYVDAINNCDILFLLRPPQISDVKKYFAPLINKVKASNIEHIVFLSVQGVEKSKIIPHHKIEKLIVDSGKNYTFFAPGLLYAKFHNHPAY